MLPSMPRIGLDKTLAIGLVLLALCAPLAPGFAAKVLASEVPAEAAASRQPQTMPPIAGYTLKGAALTTASYAGQRLLLFCFNPGLAEAELYAEALANLQSESVAHNFAIVGVAMGLDPEKSVTFRKKFGLTFPILDDSDANISTGLGLQTPLLLLGTTADAKLGLTMGMPQKGEPVSASLLENRMRGFLRIPRPGKSQTGDLDQRPLAPDFETRRLEGGEPFRLQELAGKPLVLVFFLHTCPHCHSALRFLKKALSEIPEAQRPVLIGVSSENRMASVTARLEEEGLDFFQVLADPDRSVRAAYGVFAGIPDLVFIDAQRRIVHRVQGWDDDYDPVVSRMHLAKMAGLPVPMSLNTKGYSGNEVCSVCHTEQAATWQFTNHAAAFNTLIPLGSDQDPECVGCHVVGFEKPGGYEIASPKGHLENVGCENCHGAGGGHLPASSNLPMPSDYRSACLECHNPKHSVGFDFASFLTKVSHSVIRSMEPSARKAMVEGRAKHRDLLPSDRNIVGSRACKSCHEQEYATWSKSLHARSMDSLTRSKAAATPECQSCHVTGFKRPGGFQPDVKTRLQSDLARVGCESCHGPGEAHVAPDAQRRGTILKLGDKCDSCVILQICGSCHDDANDPGFRFHVEERIDAQRHGGPGE